MRDFNRQINRQSERTVHSALLLGKMFMSAATAPACRVILLLDSEALKKKAVIRRPQTENVLHNTSLYCKA
jgi:hypothetical protein